MDDEYEYQKIIIADMKKKGIKKPLYGDECNNCGYCCRAAICTTYAKLSGDEQIEGKACPALIFEKKKYICGLATNPQHYFPNEDPESIKLMVSSEQNFGKGCEQLTHFAKDSIADIEDMRFVEKNRLTNPGAAQAIEISLMMRRMFR